MRGVRGALLIAALVGLGGARPSSADAQLQWTRNGGLSDAALQLVNVLRAAPDYGLRSEDYLTPGLQAELAADTASLDLEARARLDADLTRAAELLVQHLHAGRVEPLRAGFELARPKPGLDLPAVVGGLAQASDVRAALGAIEPHFYHYELLKQWLQRYRALAARTDLAGLPRPDKVLKYGDAYAGTVALRQLLQALGDLSEADATAASDTVLDAKLQEGLRQFQSRHGLEASGNLDRATYAALATPLSMRVRQIELSMERIRWLPPFDSPPIIVNIPQFELFALRTTEDRAANILEIPVIVGKAYPRTRTPLFVGDIQYLVFRPYWNVPRSILLREMLPKIRAKPGYLDANHLEIVRGERDDSPVVPANAENLASLAAGTLRLRQRPGPDNSLGPVKFLFPNSHDVYLHGTSAPGLFRENQRSISHGCIRVADPVALAQYVLRNNSGDWTAARITAAMSDDISRRIDVATPITVIIFYSTALATEAGHMLFFADIYGHDRKLAALLGMEPI